MYQNRTNAITINLLFLVNSYKLHGHFSLKIPQHFINGVSILDDKCTNHFLRNFLITSNKSVIKAKVKMVSTLPNITFLMNGLCQIYFCSLFIHIFHIMYLSATQNFNPNTFI